MTGEERAVTHILPEDKDLLASMGSLTLVHAQLDNALKMTIKDLTEVTKEEALDDTARQGSRELRDRVRKLARQRLGEGVALVRLQALLERANRATEKRNYLIHAVWGTEIDGGPVLRHDDHSFRPVPKVDELDTLVDTIQGIIGDFIDARFNEGFIEERLK